MSEIVDQATGRPGRATTRFSLSRRSALAFAGAATVSNVVSAHDFRSGATIKLVEFDAPDGVRLKGALYLPANSTPWAGLVVIHGAGNKPSRYEDWAEIYAKAGIATLIYDKRGCGESGGEYVAAHNTTAANLTRLTGDAVAAHGFLKSQIQTGGIPLGFTGASQAGWIIPPAALVAQANFMVLLSGPTCTTSQSQEFEAHGAAGPLEYARFLRDESETDPMALLRLMNIPGFWVYGAKDTNVPVDRCTENLGYLIRDGCPYSYFVDPEAGHFHGEAAHARVVTWLRGIANKPASAI